MQTRGEDVTPNPNNGVTAERKRQYDAIMSKAGGNLDVAYAIATDILERNVTRLQEYIISHSEEPAYDLNDMVIQVMQLRSREVQDAVEMFDFDEPTALNFVEQQESDFYADNGYMRDEFLGSLLGALQVAYQYIQSKNGYDGGGILGAVAGLVGNKVNKATLKRAAQGKKAGILGTISTGGKSHYDALVQYFKSNPDTAKQVIAGTITDESQLPNWLPADTGAVPNTGFNIAQATGLNKTAEELSKTATQAAIKKALPYIIGFAVLLIVIVIYASRKNK